MKKKQKDASVEQEAAVADCRQKCYLIYSSFISTQADTQLIVSYMKKSINNNNIFTMTFN